MNGKSMMNLDERVTQVFFWVVIGLGIAMGVESFLHKTFNSNDAETPKKETSYLYEKDTTSQIRFINSVS